MNLQMVLALSGVVVAVIGSLMLLVAAFRTSTGWGLATLLLPGAFIVFVFAHWREARNGFIVLLLASGILVASGIATRGQIDPATATEEAGEPAAESPAETGEAAPPPPPDAPQSSAQPSPAVRWVGQARDAAGAQQQQGGAAGLP